jgi:hypothetical protein
MGSCPRGTSTRLGSFRVARVGEQRQRVIDKLAHRGKTGSIRKPLFFPLNYGDDHLEGIDELNGDGQTAAGCATICRGAGFTLDCGQLSRDHLSLAYPLLEH